MHLGAGPANQRLDRKGERAVLKRFVLASFAGVGLIVPKPLQLAMLAAPT